MKLPNGNRAFVEIAKLRNYCLDPTHLRGRHKARVFASKLGITAREAPLLRDALLGAARESDNAVPGDRDSFGRRFVLDFDIQGPKARGTLRSAWIVRAKEDFPRLISCFVL
jgi:hypothetical protein